MLSYTRCIDDLVTAEKGHLKKYSYRQQMDEYAVNTNVDKANQRSEFKATPKFYFISFRRRYYVPRLANV